jgi:hypothetical protein
VVLVVEVVLLILDRPQVLDLQELVMSVIQVQ